MNRVKRVERKREKEEDKAFSQNKDAIDTERHSKVSGLGGK